VDNLVIREVQEQDIPLLWNFLKARSDAEEALFSERMIQMLRTNDHHIAIALLDSEVVGYAWVQDYGPHLRTGYRTARFHDLIVAENWRRNGIGRRLFESVKAWSRHRGVRWLQWQASPQAVGFYERLGLKGDPCPQPDYPFFEIEFPVDGH
jgi:GNAT superfamily N-acetyltransferase